MTRGDGAKEASERLLCLHGWKLQGPGEVAVIPGDEGVQETLNHQDSPARPEQLRAVTGGALPLQAAMAKHLQSRVFLPQPKLHISKPDLGRDPQETSSNVSGSKCCQCQCSGWCK